MAIKTRDVEQRREGRKKRVTDSSYYLPLPSSVIRAPLSPPPYINAALLPPPGTRGGGELPVAQCCLKLNKVGFIGNGLSAWTGLNQGAGCSKSERREGGEGRNRSRDAKHAYKGE